MIDWTTIGRVKIERAYEHIRDFERRVAGFDNPKPYHLVIHEDFEARETVFSWERLPDAKPIDPLWGAVAADAIQNLRSALDVLWHHATIPGTGNMDRRKGAYFPFPDSPDELESRLHGVKEPAIQAALQIAQTFEPHRGGATRLWLLNEINRRDKHEIPVLAVLGLGAGSLALTPPPGHGPDGLGFQFNFRFPKEGVLVEDGKELFRDTDRRRLDTDHEPQFRFQIAFGKGWPLEREPVLETLHKLAGITKAIADAFLRDPLLGKRLGVGH